MTDEQVEKIIKANMSLQMNFSGIRADFEESLQRKQLTDEMIWRAARALNDRQAEACGVHKDDQWLLYSEEFKDDAKAMLEAAYGINGDDA